MFYITAAADVSDLINELYCLTETQRDRHVQSDHTKDIIYSRALSSISFGLKGLAPPYVVSEEVSEKIEFAAKERLDARLAGLEEQDKRLTLLEAMARLNHALQGYTKAMEDLSRQIEMMGMSQYAYDKKLALGKEWEEELAEFEKVRKASS